MVVIKRTAILRVVEGRFEERVEAAGLPNLRRSIIHTFIDRRLLRSQLQILGQINPTSVVLVPRASLAVTLTYHYGRAERTDCLERSIETNIIQKCHDFRSRANTSPSGKEYSFKVSRTTSMVRIRITRYV